MGEVMFKFDENFYFTVCVIALFISILIGTAYDNYKETECRVEAIKAGLVSGEITNVCKY